MVVGTVFLNLILINTQESNYKALFNVQGNRLVKMLGHMVRLGVFVEDKDELRVHVEGVMLQDAVIEVIVWDKEKQVLFQRTAKDIEPFAALLPVRQRELILNNLQKKGTMCMEKSDRFIYLGEVYFNKPSEVAESWYFETNEPVQEKEVVGYVAVSFSKDLFHSGVHQIFIQTGFFFVIFLCVGILITFVVIRKFTEPLEKLVISLRGEKKGTSAQSDLKVLTDTYENMVLELENSFQTINELNQGLEQQVQERTQLLDQTNIELTEKKRTLEKSNRNLINTVQQLNDTQEQLIRQEKLAAMGQLVAGVAHEINNTVNFVSGALPSLHRLLGDVKELLASYEEIDQADPQLFAEKMIAIQQQKKEVYYDELFVTLDQLLANIDEGTRRTIRIIGDLKNFSRVSEEKFIFLDLNAVLESSISYLDHQLLEGITLKREYGYLAPVYCLPDQMSQVFLNILHNGIQAMDGAGELVIKTEQRTGSVHICFTDTGCGISKEELPKIFDPFFTNKEVGKGTGLGLGISYTIVKQHGGDIRVESEVGKGTVFEIVLPVQSGKESG